MTTKTANEVRPLHDSKWNKCQAWCSWTHVSDHTLFASPPAALLAGVCRVGAMKCAPLAETWWGGSMSPTEGTPPGLKVTFRSAGISVVFILFYFLNPHFNISFMFGLLAFKPIWSVFCVPKPWEIWALGCLQIHFHTFTLWWYYLVGGGGSFPFLLFVLFMLPVL